MEVLVAGVGNVLRGDDGFGVVVAQRLLDEPLPDGVQVMDVGIGGIHLVQELLRSRVDALIAIDAVDFGREPGTILVIRPDVRDARLMPLAERHDELADMHYATPERTFMLARSLDVLPPTVWVVGCQLADAERVGEGLSPELEGSVTAAVGEVHSLVVGLGVPWP